MYIRKSLKHFLFHEVATYSPSFISPGIGCRAHFVDYSRNVYDFATCSSEDQGFCYKLRESANAQKAEKQENFCKNNY